MLGFFKTKAGVFLICFILLIMALVMMMAVQKPKVTPKQVAQNKVAEPTGVAPANALPAAIIQANSSAEQAKQRTTKEEMTDNGVTVMRRPMPDRSEYAMQAQQPNDPKGKDGEGKTTQFAPGSPEANYHEGLRLAPLPKRQTQSQPSATDTDPMPRRENPGVANQTIQSVDTNPSLTQYVQRHPNDPSLGGLFAQDKQRFAPFGRLIKCELVITLESTSESTPIVGLVTEDQYWNGELIIPAGTEVHGTATVDRERDRIFAAGRWVLVMPRQGKALNGRELILTGHALDREDTDGKGMTWGITDGSFGLKGQVCRSKESEDIKLFAATFLGSAAGALQDTSTSAFGQVTAQATSKNAALSGTQAVLNKYSEMLLAEIKKNGVYIRVPAGKQWYLYVTETLMPDRAALAGSAGVTLDAKLNQPRKGTQQ